MYEVEMIHVSFSLYSVQGKMKACVVAMEVKWLEMFSLFTATSLEHMGDVCIQKKPCKIYRVNYNNWTLTFDWRMYISNKIEFVF